VTTPPLLAHQVHAVDRFGTNDGWALYWDPGCVDGQTEFLTPTGWRRIDAYQPGALVGQWHPESKRVEFVVPERYVTQDCDEAVMISSRSGRGTVQVLSPNHAVALVSKRGHVQPSVSADQLERELLNQERNYWNLPARFEMSLDEHGAPGIPLTDAQLRVQIAVMADGHFQKSSRTARCVLRLKRPRKIERIRKLLEEAGIEAYDRPAKTVPGFFVFSFTAPVKTKQFPMEWWTQMTDHQRDLIAQEVIHWDGSVGVGKRGPSYYSRHESDVDFVQFVWASQGKEVTKGFSGGVWYARSQGSSGEYFTIKADNLSRIEPEGRKVYCFTVPSGHLLLRRSGRIFPTGNCGKSCPTIHIAARHLLDKRIDRLLVVAPNLVHANWVTDELPKHCPVPWSGVVWHSRRSSTKDQQGQMVRLLKYDGGLKVLVMAYDGICTEAGRDDARRFLKGGPTMMVADEVHRIMNPKAKRTKLTLAAGQLAKIRVGLTGTPVTSGPFAAYSQVKFLDPDFWKKRGIATYTAFKAEFAVFVDAYYGGRKVQELKEYRNLEKLNRYMAEIGHRLERSAAVDLPPQVFVKRKFDLAPAQKRAYDDMVEQFRAELADGAVIEAPLALQRLMRLHQVACGFLMDDEKRVHQICEEMPRLDALEEVLEDLPEQSIVWTRFQHDARSIMARLNGDKGEFTYGKEPPPLGKVAGRYDGTVGPRDREQVLAAFRAGKIRCLVANPMAIGIGVTLNEAKASIYYSQDFRLTERLQSEARNYRVGQDRGVLVTDIVASNTVDEQVIDALVKKLDVAMLVQGDKWKEWIR
jgi:superfamily II DNA or RNA helicase